MKRQRPTLLPPVLLLQLNRWNTAHASGALLHSVEANEIVTFHAQTYILQSVVVHLGDRPNSGHYIALARHATDHGTWWLYDDARRVIARPDQIRTTALYPWWRGLVQMKSYVLFYTRRDA
jgi:ubiquitin C-terminal hydrolase